MLKLYVNNTGKLTVCYTFWFNCMLVICIGRDYLCHKIMGFERWLQALTPLLHPKSLMLWIKCKLLLSGL